VSALAATTALSNSTNFTSGNSGSSQRTAQISMRHVAVAPPKVKFGIVPGPGKGYPTQLPANTMIWETFRVDNLTYIDDIGTQLQIPSSANGSKLQLGVYLDGSLKYLETYTIEAPPVLNGSASRSFTGGYQVRVQASFPAETLVTVAVICNSPISLFVFNSGTSYEVRRSLLPSSIPTISASISAPFLFAAWGES